MKRAREVGIRGELTTAAAIVVAALAALPACGSDGGATGGGGQSAGGDGPGGGHGGSAADGGSANGGSSNGGSSANGGSAASGGGGAGGAHSGGFPDATNTGYEQAPCYAGHLTPWGGGALEDGHTYSCIDFPGGLSVGSHDEAKTGIKFVGCRFHGANPGGALVLLFGDDIAFDYCTFEPDVAGPKNVAYDDSYQYGIAGNGGYYTHVGKLTVSHSNLWGFGNAVDVNPTNSASNPQVYRDNWIHHAADVAHDVYHHDGIGAESGGSKGGYVTLDHNTIESLGNTNAVAYQATGPYTHFVVTDNLFGGFGYAVAILGGSSDVTFTGNTFSTGVDSVYGPLYPDEFWKGAGSTWRGNKWKVPAGAAWGKPEHDGWFWVPNAGSRPSGGDDSDFVSQADYAD